MLQLLDAVLASSEQATAFSGDAAGHMCSDVLLPPLVWRAGKAAAAVRFAAITALSTFLRQKLLQKEQIQLLLKQEQLLRMLFQCLEEEYFVETRLAACSAAHHLLSSNGAQLSAEHGRMLYPELLKRLDDSSNHVRASICEALAAFCQQFPSNLDDTNMSFFIKGMLIHMDDTDSEIQEAVCRVLVVLASSRPELIRQAVTAVQQLHRSDRFTATVLSACRS